MGEAARAWHADLVRARGRGGWWRGAAGWGLATLALGCRPSTLGVELPIVDGARAAVLAVRLPSGDRALAFDPTEAGGGEGALAPFAELELDTATHLELALYRCELDALGLAGGELAPASSGSPLPRTRCGFERALSDRAETEAWSHRPGLPAALAGLRVERGAERCFPSRVDPACGPAEGASAGAGYGWGAPRSSEAVLGTGRSVTLTGPVGGLGRALALDEDTLVVGAPGDDSCALGVDGAEDDDGCPGAGAAHVYRWSPEGWRREAYLKPSDTHGGQVFGGSVAVSGDTVLVGAHRSSDCPPTSPALPVCLSMGAAYVFRRTERGWEQEAILTASRRRGADWFGEAVALQRGWAAVGAPGQDSCGTGPSREESPDGCTNSGAVYLFERTPEGWVQRWILKAENPEPFARVGRQLSWAGGLLVAPTLPRRECEYDVLDFEIPSPCLRSSVVEVFSLSPSAEWRASQGLRSPVPDSNPDYAITAVTDGARVFLGHPGEIACVPDAQQPRGERCELAGAVHVFEEYQGSFVATQMLRPASLPAESYFGVSLASSRDVLLVGASGEGLCQGPDGYRSCDAKGAVLAYRRSAAGYREEALLLAPPTDSPSSAFGYAVALSEGFAAVGAPWVGEGAVFVYEPLPGSE